MMKQTALLGVLVLAGACMRVPSPQPPPGSGAPVQLCNDSGSGLRIGLNWQAVQQVPAGRCVGVRAEAGPTLVRAFTVAQPKEMMRHPAARVQLPASGAAIHYGMKGGFLLLTSVKGTKNWQRCNYPAGFGPAAPPRRASTTLWRMELDRWMRVNLTCGPNV